MAGVMNVGAGQRKGEGHALPTNQEMELAAGLPAISGIRAGVRSAPGGQNADGIQRGARPVQ
ncbi:hypothetical protein GCM10010844_34860 [Deinococcus radiotolerans]|uniref:Uncharacterized protein n=1 Tax=Deinococcus radiotolerans TaxID=1309407 RepID=A0ABQ2FP49_9DEIO|nr:hypothetical protein GCM10010844_34860 [Deinococcus radiotolerans]